ncbi:MULTISPECIES: hypothetical protein [Streptomyces]|uniref:Secreted protein n=1 Tax=Streptomyces dengpaensis TaxID=2049881 RepID=A0ABM6T0S3_9ACTN|nr:MULTISPECIES: hypothetical protein [Streptomyces]AVH60578.1 hypothetical protein C4B68_37810 [Streptomyces dengpaensis]PIB04445.1 hypothetical protein B1C81_33130 [Streptomyces sp. HG99]
MRRHIARTTMMLCGAVSLAAVVGTASAAPPGTQPVKHHAEPVIVDCFWQPEVRPDDFILACGDGNSRLISLQWSQWLPNSATAEGINVVNDCKPYCAAGKFHPYRVTVRLDDPEPWKKRPQVQHYTQITLVYTDERPDGYERTVSYPLWN